MNILEPADLPLVGVPAPVVAGLILIVAICLFCFILYKRLSLFSRLKPDPRIDNIGERLARSIIYGVLQFRQPRYLGAGVLHILLFAGFMILSVRSLTLIGRGFSSAFHLPFLGGSAGFVYEVVKDYTVLIVLAVCIIGIVRRAVFRPPRYEHPGTKGHSGEAYVILGMVSALMITDMIFDGSVLKSHSGGEGFQYYPAATIASWFIESSVPGAANFLHIFGYWSHIIVFFGLLNYLPISKHFHVITAMPNVFLSNLHKGQIKPVRRGVTDWMELPEVGVGGFEGFTWKHVLDFYSCADCGRCTDNCPANAVGRPLSPKMISIKARDYAYQHYPIFGRPSEAEEKDFTGVIITEDEIWSCTTCGACEQECPIFIEYIDKIVDMRRYLLDQGSLPQSLQKPMQQIKKKGNAYGGNKAKRGAWAKELEAVQVKELKAGDYAEYLFFVDSCGSFDPRIQEITKSFARLMTMAGIDFGILGPDETDSGNEIRRLGEEGLFEQVRDRNLEAFAARSFKEIVTFDPHAFNAIRNDYQAGIKVIHASQMLNILLAQDRLKLKNDYVKDKIVTYHDPCYLGRHNGVYNEPREVLKNIPGIHYHEMTRSYSRSFCCSGGGLLLWYENEHEKERMGERRVRMACDIEAQIIVTACPFCLINLEDAVKTTGNEGKIEVIDLVELVERSLQS